MAMPHWGLRNGGKTLKMMQSLNIYSLIHRHLHCSRKNCVYSHNEKDASAKVVKFMKPRSAIIVLMGDCITYMMKMLYNPFPRFLYINQPNRVYDNNEERLLIL